jgi:serine/threonine protein kinase
VALKVFTAGICTRDEWEDRLRRVGEMWAGLSHPHLVPVQRGGWWDGVPFLAVEYVPGGSLAGQPFPVRQTVGLVAQLAEVVSYLHRQGVVHGNLKPSNVLLAADGIPRLTDFRLTAGLSLRPPAADDSETAGLGYLAPELVRDPNADLRFYTDIYGLGLILYELLAGRQPFGGATVRETLEQVSSQPPTSPTQFHPGLSPQLAAFCLHCLGRNPWKRFERAYDVLTRLRYFLEDLNGPTVPGRRSRRS